ncbi:hypothetical protein NDU88_003566 [Pleurodeles waltl]|uniref:Uncharacterized protein n=1 Tax=Pleurodeles waltl TaxID=8319 RepID=A0AAV7KXB7_PLEWA|nr:hypothetical protein NDU88_003566 [Pleurodeles waltl]
MDINPTVRFLIPVIIKQTNHTANLEGHAVDAGSCKLLFDIVLALSRNLLHFFGFPETSPLVRKALLSWGFGALPGGQLGAGCWDEGADHVGDLPQSVVSRASQVNGVKMRSPRSLGFGAYWLVWDPDH